MLFLKRLDQVVSLSYYEILFTLFGHIISLLNISYIKSHLYFHQKALMVVNIVLFIVHSYDTVQAYLFLSYDFCVDVNPWLRSNCRSHIRVLYVIFFFEIIGIFLCGMLISQTRKFFYISSQSDAPVNKQGRRISFQRVDSEDDERSGLAV